MRARRWRNVRARRPVLAAIAVIATAAAIAGAPSAAVAAAAVAAVAAAAPIGDMRHDEYAPPDQRQQDSVRRAGGRLLPVRQVAPGGGG